MGRGFPSPLLLNPEKTVDVTYHRPGRDKRNKLLMARGDSLDLSFPPVVIFYERRPERVQHALKRLFPFSLPPSLSRARARLCLCTCVCGFFNPWTKMATPFLLELLLSTSPSVPRQFHGSHGPEIRAIGFVSNQGGNRV